MGAGEMAGFAGRSNVIRRLENLPVQMSLGFVDNGVHAV